MGLSRQVPFKISMSSTSTGNSTSFADFGTGMSAASGIQVVTGTTKAFTFTIQGSIGRTGVWTNLTAATTGSTAGNLVNSTVAMTFDKLRVNVSANGSTSTGSNLAVTLLAR